MLTILERAHPAPSDAWHNRLYAAIQGFVKYIGIPALILAAIVPVYNVGEAILQYRNQRIMREIYESYAFELMQLGSIDRATSILQELDKLQPLDVHSQYLRARLLTLTAIKQGRQHHDAEDRIMILLRVHAADRWLFPSFGGPDEVFELRQGLVDIAIQLQDYRRASEGLDVLGHEFGNDGNNRRAAQIDMRRGTIAVLTFDHDAARRYLASALALCRELNDVRCVAESSFQLGKDYHFTHDLKEATSGYDEAMRIWETVDDKFGLIKVYNNAAMIHALENRHEQARVLYEREAQLARDVRDDLALARALVNLATEEVEAGEYDKAISMATEAQGAFGRQENHQGIATTHALLADIYLRKDDTPKLLYNARQAVAIYTQLKDIRPLADALDFVGRASRDVGNIEDAVYSTLAAYALKRHEGGEKVEGIRQRMDVYVHNLQAMRATVGPEKFADFLDKAQPRVRELGLLLGISDLVVAPPATS